MEELFLISWFIALFLSWSLLFKSMERWDYLFLGVLLMSICAELSFSWARITGINSYELWNYISYWWLPVGIYGYRNWALNPHKPWKFTYAFGLLPILIQSIFVFVYGGSLMDHFAWRFLSEYAPLICSLVGIFLFWKDYYHEYKQVDGVSFFSNSLPFLVFSGVSILVLLWFVFSLIGWGYYRFLENFMIVMVIFLGIRTWMDTKSTGPNPTIDRHRIKEPYKRVELENLILSNGWFLDAKFGPKDLARYTDLSLKTIQTVFPAGQFKSYVNGLKVDEFKRRVSDPKNSDLTFLALAFDSGFASKSTFNTVFKEFTGMTPSEYNRSQNAF